MRPSIQVALDDVAAARARLNAAVRRAQKACKHLDLAECDYLPFHHGGGALAPQRVCCSCGMSEEGWGCGYLVLRGDAKRVPRDEVYALRQGLHIRDDHKGPLLRRETTVAALVDKHFER